MKYFIYSPIIGNSITKFVFFTTFFKLILSDFRSSEMFKNLKVTGLNRVLIKWAQLMSNRKYELKFIASKELLLKFQELNNLYSVSSILLEMICVIKLFYDWVWEYCYCVKLEVRFISKRALSFYYNKNLTNKLLWNI